MQIGKNWRITADNLNIILERKVRIKNRRTGEHYEEWQVQGYYSSVENALHGLIEQGVQDTQLKDLKTIVDRQKELYNLITEARSDFARLNLRLSTGESNG